MKKDQKLSNKINKAYIICKNKQTNQGNKRQLIK